MALKNSDYFSNMMEDVIPRSEQRPISLWVPKKTHKKFQLLQTKSRRACSKRLKKMIIEAIDTASEG